MAGRDHYKNKPRYVYQTNSDATLVSVADGPHIDAFARARFTSPYTLFDSVLNHTDQSNKWSGTATGSGRTEWKPNRSSNFLIVGTDSGASNIKQTKQHFQYQPGKSLAILMTGIFSPAKQNLRQRIGYFSSSSGLFFQKDNDEVSVVLRTSLTGTPVDTAYPQSEWNLDKMDGSGPSKLTLDFDKVQIFTIDFQWLGSGRVRFGFFVAGQLFYVHELLHANNIDSVFMSDPSLPCRYEISNTGPTASESTLEQICSAVISEGGYNPRGAPKGADTTSVPKNVPSTNLVPLLSIRLRPENLNSAIVPINYSVIATSNNDVMVRIVLNGSLGAANWTTVSGTESVSQVDISATSITGGEVVWAEFANQAIKGEFTISPFGDEQPFVLSSTASGVPDVLTIAAQARTANANVSASLNYREIV